MGQTSATTFSDAQAQPGATYFYAVRPLSGGGEADPSRLVRITAASASCAADNRVVGENCLPGTADWRVGGSPGIEGFATAQSIDHGQSVGLKVDSPRAGVTGMRQCAHWAVTETLTTTRSRRQTAIGGRPARRLRTGRHRLLLGATDASGNSATARALAFTVRR